MLFYGNNAIKTGEKIIYSSKNTKKRYEIKNEPQQSEKKNQHKILVFRVLLVFLFHETTHRKKRK